MVRAVEQRYVDRESMYLFPIPKMELPMRLAPRDRAMRQVFISLQLLIDRREDMDINPSLVEAMRQEIAKVLGKEFDAPTVEVELESFENPLIYRVYGFDKGLLVKVTVHRPRKIKQIDLIWEK